MKRVCLLLALLAFGQWTMASGLTTHLNMSRSAKAYVNNPELQQLIDEYDSFLLTGTVYPDFDGSVGFLPWREANGAFGMFHRGEIHKVYFDYLRDTYDLKTCVQREDAACQKAVALFLGIVAHSLQDNAWDMLFVRKAFIRDYHTDDLWVGDLDTGGDVVLWTEGRHFTFSYSAPYPDLLAIYHERLSGLDWVTENYIGDGLRTHNIALEFEDEKFWFENADDDYRSHAPWFMANMMNDEMGLPLYEEETGKLLEATWQALLSEDGYSGINPVGLMWPKPGISLDTDAYPVVIFHVPVTNLSADTVYITDALGNKIPGDVRYGDGYGTMVIPHSLLQPNTGYQLHITTDVTIEGGAPIASSDLVFDFATGDGPSQYAFWRDGNRFTKFGPGKPLEAENGPDYFALKAQNSGLCVEVKEGLVFNGSPIKIAACNNADQQKWYVRTHEPAGHTRGLKIVSKLNDDYCLGVTGNGDGQLTQLWRCDNHDNQRWIDKFDGTLRSAHSQQLALNTQGTSANKRLKIRHTGNVSADVFVKQYDNKAQQFFQMRAKHDGKCLAVNSNAQNYNELNNNTDVISKSCNLNDNSQLWALDGEGRIHTRLSWYKCLDAKGATANNNTQLIVWDCKKDANNQRWQQQGYSIRSRIDDFAAIDAASGVVLYQYEDRPSQQFDLVNTDGSIRPPVNESRACFYVDNNRQGRRLCLGVGQYDLANGKREWNDVISSIEVPVDLYVTAYEHDDFQGAELKFMMNVNNLGGFKDRISALTVRRKPHQNYACMFEDFWYGGTGICAFTGQSDPFVAEQHMNDKISSVVVSGNAVLTLYDDNGYGGNKVRFTSSQGQISFNDRASAYKVRTAAQLCPHHNASFDGANCRILSKVSGVNYWHYGNGNNGFYYSPVSANNPCPHHNANFDGANCHVFTRKNGVSYFQWFNGYYYNPVE